MHHKLQGTHVAVIQTNTERLYVCLKEATQPARIVQNSTSAIQSSTVTYRGEVLDAPGAGGDHGEAHAGQAQRGGALMPHVRPAQIPVGFWYVQYINEM